MSRSYGDPTYGAHKVITMAGDINLATNAAAATVLAHKFLTPATVLGGNIVLCSDLIGDMSAATNWLLAKSTDAGTGTTTFATCTQIYIDSLATATDAIGVAFDFESVTATDFAAGDYVYLQLEGTAGGIVSQIAVNLEVTEHYVQSDT